MKSVFEAIAESFSAVFPGVWGELVLVLIGGGAFTTGLVGLLLGGRRLPPFEIPPRLRPYANFAFVIMFLAGLTLITNTAPDFVERLVMAIVQG
ncbi:MAG: hypothetical protein FWJ83_08080 [Limnochordales bacterium]